MKSLEALWYQISITCIKVTMLVMVVLFVRQDYPAILGLLLGTAAAVFNLYLMTGSVKKTASMHPGKASSYTYSRYALRQAIAALVLVGAMFVDGVNFFWTVGGILLPKFAIIGSQLFPAIRKGFLSFSRKAG